MSVQSFDENVLESAIVEQLAKQGFQINRGAELNYDKNNPFLEKDFTDYLSQNYTLTAQEQTQVRHKLKMVSATPLYEGNKNCFLLVNEGVDLLRENKLSVHIDYLNFDSPKKNIFRAVRQLTVIGEKEYRPDVVIFINGIPLAIFEFKSAVREDTTLYDAWQQICHRYVRGIPELMKYCALSVISDGANTKMGSIFTPYSYYYAWNKVNARDKSAYGLGSLQTLLKGAFTPTRLLALLRDFIFYPDDSKKNEAIVCRYPQYFAATKMAENIAQHLKPHGDGKGGTYFGATGCGKTYTMLFLCRLLNLRNNAVFKNPTIIILTDREDLDTQASELFVTASRFLGETDVRSIESRADLKLTLKSRPSGGIYLTTIQKFCESIGELSDRHNIICISDEAHRTQTGIGSQLTVADDGVTNRYGFAYYLRASFPNATYCGFTGTPIDETLAVFGDIVERYTMKEASDDGITVRIQYEPRLARVIVSDDEAKKIEDYYQQCVQEGASEYHVNKSKQTMSQLQVILGDDDRLARIAKDIVQHYESLCQNRPALVQKAMIVCSHRKIALNLLNHILAIKPDWGTAKRSEDESLLTEDELQKLTPLPKINLVATRDQNDDPVLYEACGNKQHRQLLEKQFKNNQSNFNIAVVVDMWITGFDVPSLAVMYIDKPLKRHTLIQTISRVNRIFDGKDHGLVVDYIGFKDAMEKAVKQYGSPQESPVDSLKQSITIFRNQLDLLNKLTYTFDKTAFFNGSPLERLHCLNYATEFVQSQQETQTRFMGLSKRLKVAYEICAPSGELSEMEIQCTQFYCAVRSLIRKQTLDDTPDAEVMNAQVEKMIANAIACTGVESIIDQQKKVDLFSDETLKALENIHLPITKFNALLKLLKKTIKDYSKTNKVKSIIFDERLKAVVAKYNSRDDLLFTSEVVNDFIDSLSDEILQIMADIETDQNSFETLGISYEEKVFYDILVKVRDEHQFDYADDKCLMLAGKIKALVEDKQKFINWHLNQQIKDKLNMELVILLYDNGYPPQWNEEVFDKIMAQAHNFKKNES